MNKPEMNGGALASHRALLKSAGVALTGAALGLLSGIPLGELFGAALAVVIARQSTGMPTNLPGWVLIAVQLILGVSVGAVVKFDQLVTTMTWPAVVGLGLCLICQMAINYWWLYAKEGWTPFESLLGAVPGAMAAILMVSETHAKPSAKIVFSHSVRFFILVAVAAVISWWLPIDSTAAQAPSAIFWPGLLAVLIASLLLGKLVERLGFPAPYMVAALLCAAVSNSLFPDCVIHVPAIMLILATAMLGALIGSRLAQTTLREAIRYARAGLIVTLFGLLVTAIFAWVWSHLIGSSPVVLLLAWVPGSVEAMTAVALLLGLEPVFVMVNHIVRLLILHALPVVLKTQLARVANHS
ncbi:AbrB family transcriptional regulator [Photobacterium sp. MCCC 1A19761]